MGSRLSRQSVVPGKAQVHPMSQAWTSGGEDRGCSRGMQSSSKRRHGRACLICEFLLGGYTSAHHLITLNRDGKIWCSSSTGQPENSTKGSQRPDKIFFLDFSMTISHLSATISLLDFAFCGKHWKMLTFYRDA